jgi:hypothetical protein
MEDKEILNVGGLRVTRAPWTPSRLEFYGPWIEGRPPAQDHSKKQIQYLGKIERSKKQFTTKLFKPGLNELGDIAAYCILRDCADDKL